MSVRYSSRRKPLARWHCLLARFSKEQISGTAHRNGFSPSPEIRIQANLKIVCPDPCRRFRNWLHFKDDVFVPWVRNKRLCRSKHEIPPVASARPHAYCQQIEFSKAVRSCGCPLIVGPAPRPLDLHNEMTRELSVSQHWHPVFPSLGLHLDSNQFFVLLKQGIKGVIGNRLPAPAANGRKNLKAKNRLGHDASHTPLSQVWRSADSFENDFGWCPNFLLIRVDGDVLTDCLKNPLLLFGGKIRQTFKVLLKIHFRCRMQLTMASCCLSGRMRTGSPAATCSL